MSLYKYVPHPHIAHRKQQGPVLTGELPSARPEVPKTANPVVRFNTRFAIICTTVVGSMWCAYAFAVLSIAGLPQATGPGGIGLLYWISGSFLQLTLLSVILVGQNVQATKAVELARIQAEASDQRAQQTFLDVEALLASHAQIQEHLAAQDELLTELTAPGKGDVQ